MNSKIWLGFGVATIITGFSCGCVAQAQGSGIDKTPQSGAKVEEVKKQPAEIQPTKVDANSLKERPGESFNANAPIMSEADRNQLYFNWLAIFGIITASIIGFILYKTVPRNKSSDLSLEEASDAYDDKKVAADKADTPVSEPPAEKLADDHAVPNLVSESPSSNDGEVKAIEPNLVADEDTSVAGKPVTD